MHILKKCKNKSCGKEFEADLTCNPCCSKKCYYEYISKRKPYYERRKSEVSAEGEMQEVPR